MAHLVAAGHTWAGIAGFCFAIFGITWAWINFSWFASAHHTDDWPYRLIGETGAVLAVAIPVLVFVITLFSLWAFLFRSPDKVHPITVTATCLVIPTSVWMATAHVPISVALIVLCFAPALVVVAYELYGHRHQARALAERSTGARRRMRGVRLLSTDGPVDVGVRDGLVVQGRLADLLLLVTGRTDAALGRLAGEGVETLRSRFAATRGRR